MCDKIVPAAIRGRVDENYQYSQRLEPHGGDVTNALTTVQKDNVLIVQPKELLARGGVSHCIEASYGHGITVRKNTGRPRRQTVMENARLRRLTPLECWRLMGFSDSDFNKARNRLNQNCYGGRDRASSQLYRQAGNSIVVDVLLYIMESLRGANPELFKDVKVGSFFSGIGAFEKALSRLGEGGEK